MINVTDVTEIDPNADRCPWCGKTRIWKGRHAAAQHPAEWEEFKNYFEKDVSGSVTWKEP